MKAPTEINDQAGRLARLLGAPGIGGSDAHGPADVGRAATLFPRAIRSESELVRSLAAGDYEAVLL